MTLRREKRKRASDRTSSFLVGAFGAKSSTATVGESGQFSPEGLHQRGVIMLELANIPYPVVPPTARPKHISTKNISPGEVYGELTVLTVIERPTGNKRFFALCSCSCGKSKEISIYNLLDGHTKSCGCVRLKGIGKWNVTHGMSTTPEYKIWQGMWARCTNPNNSEYHIYKDRVPVESWEKFENFISDMGLRPSSKHTLERVDNEKGYAPENCVWLLKREQGKNTSTTRWVSNGHVTLCLADACRLVGLRVGTVVQRINVYKWPIERALGLEWSEKTSRFEVEELDLPDPK